MSETSPAFNAFKPRDKFIAFRSRMWFGTSMESTPDISSYSYLWTTEFPNWVLLDLGNDEKGLPSRLVVNRQGRPLLITDNASSAAVKEEMLKHGCKVVNPDFFKDLYQKG